MESDVMMFKELKTNGGLAILLALKALVIWMFTVMILD
jgi:hypothetical protein